MNTLAGLLSEASIDVEVSPDRSVRDSAEETISIGPQSMHDEQIHGLVQQLFLQNHTRVRHVGFTTLDAGSDVAAICLSVAKALADSGAHDVGLIDAGVRSTPLQTQVEAQLEASTGTVVSLGKRLWLVPRENWLGQSAHGIWEPNLARLRTAAMEFDYSIIAFDPISWVTTRISQVCDGLVLLLTAHKTHRMVAAQIREHLNRAHVPVLGAVLTGRRFPVPESLYRNL